jgi:hypothetical protein
MLRNVSPIADVTARAGAANLKFSDRRKRVLGTSSSKPALGINELQVRL